MVIIAPFNPDSRFKMQAVGSIERRALPLNRLSCILHLPHQGSASPTCVKVPVGPSAGRVASSTLVRPPSDTSIGAFSPPMSVFTQPGCAELTLIGVARSSSARWTVKALSAVFEAL
eukprot:c35875_g1_i1.p2 GENE.c35875_g1_i1~~c35875_g1_i1.p2  ORF type:complete len:117 (+),score=12.16 c35875_g1_i1:3-353(+)